MFLCPRIFLINLLITLIVSGLFFSPFLFYKTVQASQTSVIITVTAAAVCGNGAKEWGESCDPPDFNGETCVSLGYGGGGTLKCYIDCTFNVTECSATPSTVPVAGGGGGYTPPSSILVLQGITSPGAIITILKDGEIFIVGQEADSSGNFEMRIFDISAGVHTFSFRVKDKENRESVAFSVTFTLSEAMTTTISGIFLPPTVGLKGNVLKGETAPQSEVSISISSAGKEVVKNTKAKIDGTWSYDLGNANLQEKTLYIIKAKASSPDGLMSAFSQSLEFYFKKAILGVPEVPEVPKVPGIPADLNGDGKVNLIDFSILLYWWGKNKPGVDLNNDGVVGLRDFSIMMYYWTG